MMQGVGVRGWKETMSLEGHLLDLFSTSIGKTIFLIFKELVFLHLTDQM